MADAPFTSVWAPGASKPSNAPVGKVWDDHMAAYVDDPNAATAPAWTTDPQWTHLDPRLAALYVKNKRAPTGAGTGFTDANYWDNKIKSDPNYDFLTRLDKDLQGVGTDRSTGTVWGDAGAPAGVDQFASDTANYGVPGGQLAALGGAPANGVAPVFDVTSQGNGPGSYAWRQAQIYALQQRLVNGGSR